MNSSHDYFPSVRSLGFMAASAAALLIVGLMHKTILTDTGIFAEAEPLLTPKYLLCSLVIAIATVCACLGIIYWQKDRTSVPQDYDLRLDKFHWQMLVLALAIAGAFLLLFLFNPPLFNSLSLEDGVVEWSSALLLFAAAIICLVGFFRLNGVGGDTLMRAALLILALVLFVIGMEEISWMQRVFGFGTPAQLEQANIQGEMNLHNFATEPVEIAYYFGTFIFTVILPFMRAQGVFPLNNLRLSLLVPRPFLVFIGALISAFTYDMWNIFLIQATFYASCFVLIYFIARSPYKAVAVLAGVVLAVTVFAQGSFIYFADNYAREWEITEYKELLIPLAFLAYSLDVLRQLRARRGEWQTASVHRGGTSSHNGRATSRAQ